MRTDTAESAERVLTTTIADLPRHLGRKLGPTDWQAMMQDGVNQFADLTNDHNFIHVDPERARLTPFRGTIAHGFLTLSMLGPISQQLVVVDGCRDVDQLRAEQGALSRAPGGGRELSRPW